MRVCLRVCVAPNDEDIVAVAIVVVVAYILFVIVLQLLLVCTSQIKVNI